MLLKPLAGLISSMESRRERNLPRATASSRRKLPGRGPLALTGTPGSGKSSVAAELPASVPWIEVGAWALAHGFGHRRGTGTVVDLESLRRRFWRLHARDPHAVYVGHLAHLLPLEDVVLLRCHPLELGRRLEASRRGLPEERAANVAAEAVDVILAEALDRGRRVWEVDTTGRNPAAVARAVARRYAVRGPPRWGRTRWLADPAVTTYLLERAP